MNNNIFATDINGYLNNDWFNLQYVIPKYLIQGYFIFFLVQFYKSQLKVSFKIVNCIINK